MRRRTRAQQVADEKAAVGATGGYMTSGEICVYLGITPRLFRARLLAGKIPKPHITSQHGWGLWSPEQTAELLKQELAAKEARRNG